MEDWEQCSAARYRSWKNKGKARIVPGDMGKQTDCVPVWDWTMGLGICYEVGICYIYV